MVVSRSVWGFVLSDVQHNFLSCSRPMYILCTRHWLKFCTSHYITQRHISSRSWTICDVNSGWFAVIKSIFSITAKTGCLHVYPVQHNLTCTRWQLKLDPLAAPFKSHFILIQTFSVRVRFSIDFCVEPSKNHLSLRMNLPIFKWEMFGAETLQILYLFLFLRTIYYIQFIFHYLPIGWLWWSIWSIPVLVIALRWG